MSPQNQPRKPTLGFSLQLFPTLRPLEAHQTQAAQNSARKSAPVHKELVGKWGPCDDDRGHQEGPSLAISDGSIREVVRVGVGVLLRSNCLKMDGAGFPFGSNCLLIGGHASPPNSDVYERALFNFDGHLSSLIEMWVYLEIKSLS